MKIIDRMPLGEGTSEVWTPDGIAVVKPCQIVVMVSLSEGDILEPGSRRFPAILDTGLNHNFAIRHEHLDRWTALRLPTRKSVTIQKQEIPLAAAYVWVHRNVASTNSPSDSQPIRLRTPEGIAVFPENAPNPARLPILGLRALVRNNLTLIMDGKRRRVTLKTPGWF
jgi:hypothetical protein